MRPTMKRTNAATSTRKDKMAPKLTGFPICPKQKARAANPISRVHARAVAQMFRSQACYRGSVPPQTSR
jgi:hypothetical protein